MTRVAREQCVPSCTRKYVFRKTMAMADCTKDRRILVGRRKMESGAHQGNAAGIILEPSTFPMPRERERESGGTALGKGGRDLVDY